MSGPPTTFPVWLSKPGAPDAVVNDIGSYNYAVSQGYTLPGAGVAVAADSSSTPVQQISPTSEIAETPISSSQPLDVPVAGEPAVVQQTSC